MSSYLVRIREALIQAFVHDVVNTSKAAAYSGMLMFFPALLVITTLVAQVEEGPSLVGETRAVLEQFLPPDTLDLVQSSILNHQLHSGQLILSATCLSLFAGLGVMLSLMEGFRRAYQLPPERLDLLGTPRPRADAVFIALVPLSLASLVIVFGHQIELWIIDNAGHDLRHIVIFFWRMVRWTVSFVAILDRAHCALPFRHPPHGALVLGRCPAPSRARSSGSRPRSPTAGMSPASPTTPASTDRSPPGSPLWSGFTSLRSACCWARS